MALINYSALLFACWTAAYQAILITRLPAGFLYFAFPALAIPAVVVYAKTARRQFAADAAKDKPARSEWLRVVIVSALCAVLAMVVSWPNWDDLGYFHRALYQLRRLGSPFIMEDTLHNTGGLAVVSKVQLLTSWETASAFAAKLLGLDPLAFYQNLTGAFCAFLVPVAYFFLYREMGLARLSSAAALGAALFLWLDGGLHLSFGNMAFVRMSQGKAVFFTLGVPVLFLYMHRYAERPNFANWLMAALAVVCGVGLTSSALFITPVLFAAFTAAFLANKASEARGLEKDEIKKAALLNAAWIYCIALALAFHERGGLAPIREGALEPPLWRPAEGWTGSVGLVLGSGWSLVWYGLLMAAVPWLALKARQARVWAFYTAMLVVICFNPVTGPFLWERIGVFSRFAYLLPIPLCAGLAAALAMSLMASREGTHSRTARLALLAALFASALLSGGRATFASGNNAHLKPPMEYKFFRESLAFCKAVSGDVNNRNLLCPEEIAAVLPLMDDSVRLETARWFYTAGLFEKAGKGNEGRRRVDSQAYLKHASPDKLPAFEKSVIGGVDAIVAREEACPEVLAALSKLPGKWDVAYRDGRYALILRI